MIRAFNVLRQYDEGEVAAAWERLRGRLAPGGLLLTISCSGSISADLFHKIVAGAGIDAGTDGIIKALGGDLNAVHVRRGGP